MVVPPAGKIRAQPKMHTSKIISSNGLRFAHALVFRKQKGEEVGEHKVRPTVHRATDFELDP